jgi:hypothetical protein
MIRWGSLVGQDSLW